VDRQYPIVECASRRRRQYAAQRRASRRWTVRRSRRSRPRRRYYVYSPTRRSGPRRQRRRAHVLKLLHHRRPSRSTRALPRPLRPVPAPERVGRVRARTRCSAAYAVHRGRAHYCGRAGGRTASVRGRRRRRGEIKYRHRAVRRALLRICRLCMSVRMPLRRDGAWSRRPKFSGELPLRGRRRPKAEGDAAGTYDPGIYLHAGKLELAAAEDWRKRQEGGLGHAAPLPRRRAGARD